MLCRYIGLLKTVSCLKRCDIGFSSIFQSLTSSNSDSPEIDIALDELRSMQSEANIHLEHASTIQIGVTPSNYDESAAEHHTYQRSPRITTAHHLQAQSGEHVNDEVDQSDIASAVPTRQESPTPVQVP